MTFVLQLHFVKMKLNLKQKKNAKKDVLRFDYLLYFFFFFFLTPSYWTAIPSKLDLLIFIPDVFPFTSYNNLTVTVANCYHIDSTLGLMVEVKGCLKTSHITGLGESPS